MTIKRVIEHEGLARRAGGSLWAQVVRIQKVLAVITLALNLSGCGDHDLPPEMTKQAVKFDDVPEIVRSAATKAIPGVNLNEAWKNLERGGQVHSYEIRGKNSADGKTREVRVSLTGEILEME
jgi:hypothetical protein